MSKFNNILSMKITTALGNSFANYVILTSYYPQVTYAVYSIFSCYAAYYSPSISKAFFKWTVSYISLGCIRPFFSIIACSLASNDKTKEMDEASSAKLFIH